jgi:hypothetical protein
MTASAGQTGVSAGGGCSDEGLKAKTKIYKIYTKIIQKREITNIDIVNLYKNHTKKGNYKHRYSKLNMHVVFLCIFCNLFFENENV